TDVPVWLDCPYRAAASRRACGSAPDAPDQRILRDLRPSHRATRTADTRHHAVTALYVYRPVPLRVFSATPGLSVRRLSMGRGFLRLINSGFPLNAAMCPITTRVSAELIDGIPTWSVVFSDDEDDAASPDQPAPWRSTPSRCAGSSL